MQDFQYILQSCSFPGILLVRLPNVRLVFKESVTLTPISIECYRFCFVFKGFRVQISPSIDNIANEIFLALLTVSMCRRHSRTTRTSNRLKSLPYFATDFTRITHFQVTQFQTYTIFREWKNEVMPFRKARLILICGNEAQ